MLVARSISIRAAALLLLVAATGPAGAFCPAAFRAAPALRSRWTCSDEVPRVPSQACAAGKELNGQRRDALRDMLGAGLLSRTRANIQGGVSELAGGLARARARERAKPAANVLCP